MQIELTGKSHVLNRFAWLFVNQQQQKKLAKKAEFIYSSIFSLGIRFMSLFQKTNVSS
jgi:hypothetical protein